MEEKLYTVEEAAAKLGIHAQSLRNAMASGRISYYMPEPARIAESAIEGYRKRSQPGGNPKVGRPKKVQEIS